MEQKSTGPAPVKQKVKVAVRVRPQLEENDESWVHAVDKTTLLTINHRNRNETLQYEFESVFGPDTSQASIYNEAVRPLLKKTFHGQNASIFAYGPTGAGKTHTILGTSTDPGIIPRCVKDVFSLAKEDAEIESKNGQPCTTKIQFSYLEIYQEKVCDLLKPGSGDLPIREDQHRNIFVTGLSERTIINIEEFNELFGPASRNRTTAATKLNERSSRSHSILLLKVTRSQTTAPFRRQIGKMYVIDLAGSEDNRRTGNKGIRLKESGAINSSLLALGQVVDALHKGKTCIPYRSSKLTRLLQDSLGGSSHACMMVNLAPEERHYFDTHSTLVFARKTKKVINTVKTNETYANITKVFPKKRPLEEKSSKQESPPKRQKTEPVPFLSPLLRGQEKLRKDLKNEMFSRLEELEGRIMTQMKSCQPDSKSTTALGDSDNVDALEDIMHQLKQFKDVELASTKKQRNSTNIDKTSETKPKIKKALIKTEPLDTVDNGTPDHLEPEQEKKPQLKSITNMKKEAAKDKKVFSDGSSMSGLVTTETFSSSPLFAKSSFIKKKGFTSTAAKKAISPETPVQSKASAKQKENTTMNADVQQAHNERILMILNTGTLKELQALQTIGGKRANLIQSWRDLYGHFTKFDDLEQVTGLTAKYVANFLRSNFVHGV